MTKKIIMALAIILLLSVSQLTGCSQEKTSAGQIAPFAREKIKVVSINSGNSVTKSTTDQKLINALIDELEHIQFSRMNTKQEAEVLDQGRAFSLESTLTVHLMENELGPFKATIIMPSQEVLLLAESETMEKSRTILYRNQTDEGSLNAVKQIYILASKALEEVKLSLYNWKYNYQWDFYTHQIRNGETEITPVTKIFIHDYFSRKGMELRLLPDFSPGGTPEWGELSDFIIANTHNDWADEFMTEKEFNAVIGKYFDNITLAPKPTIGLTYEDGKYTPAGGFSFHGSFLYELTGLEKGKTGDGRDKWKANIKGYYFHELDGSSEADEHQSKNARVVWKEMKKEENRSFNFWEVRDRLVMNDPSSKLDLGCEWTIEFTVNDPMDDLYFTYLSCESKWQITN